MENPWNLCTNLIILLVLFLKNFTHLDCFCCRYAVGFLRLEMDPDTCVISTLFHVEYTASVWLIWHPSDLRMRCAHTSTSGESAFCVGAGGRQLGTISRRGVFQPCGYEISGDDAKHWSYS